MRRAVAFAVLLLATACSQGSGIDAAAEKPVVTDVVRAFDVRASGALDIRFAGDHEMRFIARRSSLPQLQPTTLATASSMEPIEFRSGRGFVVGVSVVGGYEGDGTYTVRPRQDIKPSPGASVNFSVVRVLLYDMTTTPPTLDRQFENASTCRVRVAQDATVGDVRCGRLEDDRGRAITLQASWG